MAGPFKPFTPYRASDHAAFFGRAAEAEKLAEILVGARRSALLFGEAGIGKTSLVIAALGPRWNARGIDVALVDFSGSGAIALPAGTGERIAVIDDAEVPLEDAAGTARLVDVLRRGAHDGWRFLFVVDDEALGRLLPLEERMGSLFLPDARVRLDRFTGDVAGNVIEQTFLATGAYVEAGLSQTIAGDLVARGPVSPSLLQVVCAQALSERLTTAQAYQRSGGALPLLHRFIESACQAAGAGAERVLSELASTSRRGVLAAETLSEMTGIPERKIERLGEALAGAGLLRTVAAGYQLGHEWLRPHAREFVGEARGATARVRRLLEVKTARGALLGPSQLREVRRHAGGISNEEQRLVGKSRTVWRSVIALVVLTPLVAGALAWRSVGHRYSFDLAGGEVVARLGPRSTPLRFVPRSPPLGTIVGATGLARAAFVEDPVGREGALAGDAWMSDAARALAPLPRAITALALDGDATLLRSAAADPLVAPRAIEVLGALGRGAPADGELLDQALADKSDEMRRRAVVAAVAIEARAPGATGKTLERALDDKSPSVRSVALDAAIARGAAPLLVRALGLPDAAMRKRAAAPLPQLVKDHPEIAPLLVAALGGAGHAEAEPLVAALVETDSATGKAIVAALGAVAADPKAEAELRLTALRLLRRAPAPPADAIDKAIAGPPKVAGAALGLLARIDPARALTRISDGGKAVPVRAGAAAALAFLPRDADTPKRWKAALADASPEVRIEAVRASPSLGREALPILAKVLKGDHSDVERAAIDTLAGAPKLGAGGVDLLLQTAQKGKSALRRPAIDALGALHAVNALTALTRSKEAETRHDAVVALGPSPLLRQLARDPEPSVRRAAVQALATARGAAGAKALAAFLSDSDAEVRADAATALAAQGARDQLIPFVADKDPAVRAAARRSLGQATAGKASVELERGLARALTDGDADERAAIADLASGAPSVLRRAAADSDARVRRAAARAATVGRASDVLRLLAADAEVDVRRAAVEGLGAAGAIAELEAALALEPDPSVREAALGALAAGEPARALLERSLGDPSERIRAAAVRGLAGQGAAARPLLDAALRDPASDVRAAAVAAVGRVAASDPAEVLARRLADSEADADLRFATAYALCRQASDASRVTAAAAVAALDQAAASGPPAARIAARFARAFVGHPDDLVPFVAAYRRGR